MSEKVAAKVLISGRVQGVGFRYFTTDLAKKFDITGWIRNLATGDVEVHMEGDKGPVAGFLKELKIGPRFATVSNFQIEWMTHKGEYESFTVRF